MRHDTHQHGRGFGIGNAHFQALTSPSYSTILVLLYKNNKVLVSNNWRQLLVKLGEQDHSSRELPSTSLVSLHNHNGFKGLVLIVRLSSVEIII